MSSTSNSSQPRRSWFRFSLRTIFLLALLVAVYLAGRYGDRPRVPDTLAGSWRAELPAGFQQPTTLKHMEGNRFLLSSRASVFDGIYQWNDNTLTIVEPDDQRMKGLQWQWNGEQLLLVAEPKDTPTGPSYLGTTLERVDEAVQAE